MCCILQDSCQVEHVPFVRMVKLKFLPNFQWILLPTQSCLVLYSFCGNLLHSLIMWLIVMSLSLHNLHLLFYCILSILALIWLFFIALFYAAIRRDSVSLLRFPFLSHVHVISWEILFISRLKRPLSCFFPIFVLWWLLFGWSSCCQYFFWWL